MSELEILREFYETVKAQNSGAGAYFLMFSNAVKNTLEICENKLQKIDDDWRCPKCSGMNASYYAECDHCGTLKP